jgi:hypothetical protein
VVSKKYGKNEFEKQNYALLALMSLYGIEILLDNIEECRENILQLFNERMKIGLESELSSAAIKVLAVNIVHGDALTMCLVREHSTPITFSEWTYAGKGKFHRRDFRYETLTQMSSFGEGTLFEDVGKHEIFIPTKEYPLMSIGDIANG